MRSGPARVPEAWSRQPAGVATGEGSGWGRRGGLVAISLAIFRGALALSSSGAGLPSAGLEASVVGGGRSVGARWRAPVAGEVGRRWVGMRWPSAVVGVA